MALRRKAAVVEPVPAPEPEVSTDDLKLQMEQRLSDVRADQSRYQLRLDVTKASISAAAAISNSPSQIAHIAVQIADAVIAELAKEKV